MNTKNVVIRALYRSLFRIAKSMDQRPALRGFISAYSMKESNSSSLGKRHDEDYIALYNKTLTESILHNKTFYIPSSVCEDSSLIHTLRRIFKQDHVNESLKIDSAFLALRKFSNLIAHAAKFNVEPFVNEMNQSLENQRKKVRNIPVHLSNTLEPGTFLISHPLLEYPFCRCVILLVEHHKNGSKGFIINQPTEDALQTPFHVKPNVRKTFGSNRVRYGGPVPMAQFIHCHAEIGGLPIPRSPDMPFTKDVYVGGDLKIAIDRVKQKEMSPEDCIFISGHSCWKEGQLENEIEMGTWIPVNTSIDLALSAEYNTWKHLLSSLGGAYTDFVNIPETSQKIQFHD